MQIVHIAVGHIPIPPNRCAGAERFVYFLSKYLSQLKCDVHVIDVKADIPERKEIGVTFHEVWNPPIFGKGTFRRITRCLIFALLASLNLRRLIRRNKVDIIHTYSPYSGVAIWITKRLSGWRIPIIHTPCNHDLIMHPSWVNKLKYIFEFTMLKKADHIVAMTETARYQLKEKFNIEQTRITQIFEGVDYEEINSFISNKPTQYTKGANKVVFYPARVCPRKNQLALVEAALKIREVFPQIEFVFTGPIDDSSYFKAIQKFIRNAGLSPWVKFLGDVSAEQLYKGYQNAAIFVFPTLYEMQGDVLLEAMAFGLPVVASRIGPIEDVVSLEEGSAILVDPHSIDEIADAVILLLQDQALRQRLSSKGRKLVSERFSWDKIAQETLTFYESIVAK